MDNQNPNLSKSSVKLVEVQDDSVGQRLDNFLLKTLKKVPKSKVYNIIRKGEVRVNKGRVKPVYKLQLGDIVRIPPIQMLDQRAPAPVSTRLESLLEKNIIFEDAGLLVVNKPSGLAVHGGSGINLGLIEALRQIRPKDRQLELVHRLDRDTSGCIMVARKRSVLRHLHQQLQQRKMKKQYLALVCGRWPSRRRVVDAPLLKTHLASGERIVRISPEGKPSRTEFSVIDRFQDATLVEARPITGRTHQIRVHALQAGCPLVGDEKYTGDSLLEHFKRLGANRLFLHAWKLSFTHPESEQIVTVEAPLATELSALLEKLD